MLGEQFMVGEEICGAVISIRFQVTICYTLLLTHWIKGDVSLIKLIEIIFYVGGYNFSVE